MTILEKFLNDYSTICADFSVKTISENMSRKYNPYGSDEVTKEFETFTREKLQKTVNVYWTNNGTGANAIGLSLSNHEINNGTVFACKDSHLVLGESTMVSHICGINLHCVASLDPQLILEACRDLKNFEPHSSVPKVLYVGFPDNDGTIIPWQKLIELGVICSEFNIKMYIDGARIITYLLSKECDYPYVDSEDIFWGRLKSIVHNLPIDALSIGGLKNNLLGGDVVLHFPRKEDGNINHFTSIKSSSMHYTKSAVPALEFLNAFKHTDWMIENTKKTLDVTYQLVEQLRKHGIDHYWGGVNIVWINKSYCDLDTLFYHQELGYRLILHSGISFVDIQDLIYCLKNKRKERLVSMNNVLNLPATKMKDKEITHCIETIDEKSCREIRMLFDFMKDDCSLDAYYPLGNRYRCYSWVNYENGKFNIDSEKYSFLQDATYNSYLGSVQRFYRKLPVQLLESAAFIGLLNKFIFHLPEEQAQRGFHVHMIRVYSNNTSTVLAPEGVHQDGYSLCAIAAITRNNLSGAVNTLRMAKNDEPFYEAIVNEGDILIFDDQVVWHEITDMKPIDNDKMAWRDIFVLHC